MCDPLLERSSHGGIGKRVKCTVVFFGFLLGFGLFLLFVGLLLDFLLDGSEESVERILNWNNPKLTPPLAQRRRF